MGKQSRRPGRRRITAVTAVALTCCLSAEVDPALAFVPAHPLASSSCGPSPCDTRTPPPLTRRHLSDGAGGGLGDRPPPGGGDGGGGDGGSGRKGGKMDDFFDKDQNPESDNLRQAREMMSEDSLPLSFGFERSSGDNAADDESAASKEDEDGGKLTRTASGGAINLQDNPYLEVVSRLSPSDLISKFTSTAHPRVQDAVRSTILGLIGNLPKMAFDTTTVTTGERLASLMFQLQMSGYMFKNAEYRLSLSQSLGMDHLPTVPEGMAKNGRLLEGTLSPHHDDADEDDDEADILGGKVQGKIRVKYGSNGSKRDEEEDGEDDDDNTAGGLGGMEVEVDAAAYMSELRDEVAKLKEDLSAIRKSKDDVIKKDLLLYIRTMPKEELASLTNTISPEVLAAMKGLVSAVMGGIGEGKKIEPDTITEQSGEAMAQLCMWQLVVGYNLRELEVREEMRAALTGSPKEDGKDETGRTWYGSG